jgi:hypothetical protein
MVSAKAGRRFARHRGFHLQRVTATGRSAPWGCLIAGRLRQCDQQESRGQDGAPDHRCNEEKTVPGHRKIIVRRTARSTLYQSSFARDQVSLSASLKRQRALPKDECAF